MQKPDIICIDEVDHFFDTLEPYLKQHGYVGKFQAKPTVVAIQNKPTPKWGEGEAIFINEKTLTLLETDFMTYDHQNQVAILAKLKLNQTNKVNIHNQNSF